MELDTDKIDEAVLALLALGRHDGYRTWKSFDWDSMGRLHEKGYITDPVDNAKSVQVRAKGRRYPKWSPAPNLLVFGDDRPSIWRPMTRLRYR